jgi:hypothetical protein
MLTVLIFSTLLPVPGILQCRRVCDARSTFHNNNTGYYYCSLFIPETIGMGNGTTGLGRRKKAILEKCNTGSVSYNSKLH